jgi:hypothetical protein
MTLHKKKIKQATRMFMLMLSKEVLQAIKKCLLVVNEKSNAN